MFKRKDYSEFTDHRSHTRLVQGTVIRGNISSADGLCVEGTVVGDIACSGKVIIRETGFLEGDLSCRQAELSGRVRGDVFSSGMIRIRSTGKIEGDLHSGTIEVEPGAWLEGQLSIKPNPENDKQYT